MRHWCNLNLVLVVALMALCFFLEDNRATMPHWLVISSSVALILVVGRYVYQLLTQPQPQHDLGK